MRAMVLDKVGKPLTHQQLAAPVPRSGELLIKVAACAVCRTDLHILKGELPNPKLPLILGHEIVGTVVQSASWMLPSFLRPSVNLFRRRYSPFAREESSFAAAYT